MLDANFQGNRDGFTVYLSVGGCGWVPRRYRGRDIARWLVDLGLLERTADTLPSPAARLACFPQVSEQGGGRDLNVHTLARDGTILIGRVCGADRGEVFVAADLRASLDKADAFAAQIKHAIDIHRQRAPRDGDRPDDWPTLRRRAYREVAAGGRLRLQSERISSVIWACGFRPDFGWVKLPIFDPLGFPAHQRGVSRVTGLYFLGLPWLHKWKSATLLGVSDDAEYIAEHIAANRRSRTGANQ